LVIINKASKLIKTKSNTSSSFFHTNEKKSYTTKQSKSKTNFGFNSVRNKASFSHQNSIGGRLKNNFLRNSVQINDHLSILNK